MEKIDINAIRKSDLLKDTPFKEDENFDYYVLDEDKIYELERFFDVMSKSTSHLIFARNSLEDNLDIHKRGGMFIGVYENDILIAVAITDKLKEDSYLLKYSNISKQDISKSIIIDTICVLPIYRGNYLQQKLMAVCEYMYYLQGYKYIISTVSPYNYHSLKNMFFMNYVVFDIQNMYETEKNGAVTRCIVSKEIGKKLEEVPEQYSVLNSDVEAQKKVLSLDFVGMKIVNVFSNEKFFISYSKAFYE